MKRNLLAVLLVLPLTVLATRSSPASGLPTGHITNVPCGGIGAIQATCWQYCCTAAGVYLRTVSGRGTGSSCDAAYTTCARCLPACNTGETVCNSGGGCL